MSTQPEIILTKLLDPRQEGSITTFTEMGERTPSPWESAMQATCECLSWRGTLDNLDRRQTEDALGETVYTDYPVHTRSALIVTHALLDRGHITVSELEDKLAGVRRRFEAGRADAPEGAYAC